MRRTGLGLLSVLSAVALGGPVAAHEYTSKGVTVAHPWVRAAPGGSTVTAAYLEIKGAKGTSDRLIGATTSKAKTIELHRTVMTGAVARMDKVDTIAVPAGKSVVLGPNGYHIMLMDMARPLKEGELMTLSLVFEKAGAIEVEASVEPAGAKGPHGFDHQPGHGPAPGAKKGVVKHVH